MPTDVDTVTTAFRGWPTLTGAASTIEAGSRRPGKNEFSTDRGDLAGDPRDLMMPARPLEVQIPSVPSGVVEETIQRLSAKDRLSPDDLARILDLAAEHGDQRIRPEAMPAVVKVICQNKETPETRVLRKLNNGEMGYRAGPEIDFALLGCYSRRIEIQDFIQALRRLGIDAICVISAQESDIRSTSWQVFYRVSAPCPAADPLEKAG